MLNLILLIIAGFIIGHYWARLLRWLSCWLCGHCYTLTPIERKPDESARGFKTVVMYRCDHCQHTEELQNS